MKFWKKILLTTLTFLAIISTVIYTSCERNVCNNVNCFNGGSCSGGTCRCPLGYEGPQCQTLSVSRYIGVYAGGKSCDNNASIIDSATIVADGLAINTVAITLNSIKPKVLHGYVNSNESTYSVIITNNDSLSTDTTVNTKKYTVTLQSDVILSIVSYTNIENALDTVKNSVCTFLGTKH